MPRFVFLICGLALVGGALSLAACGGSAAGERAHINGRALTDDEIAAFEQRFGATPVPGRYWYDARSGMWGREGEPAAGFLPPNLDYGALEEEASRGDSNVIINGRRLPGQEVLSWQWMLGVPILPGRYWVDHMGNYGAEGMPMAAGNLMFLLAQRGGGGGQGPWSTRFSAGNYDPNSGAGYVSVPGHGPIGFGM